MKLNPYLAVVVAATIGAGSGVFVKIIQMPATTLAFFRLLVPTVLLLMYFAYKRQKVFTGNYKIMLLASAFNAIRVLLYFGAMIYTTISNAIIIFFTWPAFASLMSMYFLKEKVTKGTSFLIATSFIGIIIMYLGKDISFSNNDFIGMGFMLVSAILYSFTAVMFKDGLKKYSRSHIILFQNCLGGLIFLPFMFTHAPVLTTTEINILIAYGFILGIIAFNLFFYGLQKLKLSDYSVLTYWEVPAAVIFGAIFFGEVLTINMLIGGGMIVLSGLMLRKGKTQNTALNPE